LDRHKSVTRAGVVVFDLASRCEGGEVDVRHRRHELRVGQHRLDLVASLPQRAADVVFVAVDVLRRPLLEFLHIQRNRRQLRTGGFDPFAVVGKNVHVFIGHVARAPVAVARRMQQQPSPGHFAGRPSRRFFRQHTQQQVDVVVHEREGREFDACRRVEQPVAGWSRIGIG